MRSKEFVRVHLCVLVALALLIPSGLATASPQLRPEPNGAIPLYLMGSPTPEREKVALLAKIVEVDPDSGAAKELKGAGAKVIFYDWLFARYEWEKGVWNESNFLVKFEGPYGPALAYDYGSEEVRSLRAKELVDKMVRLGYDGVFFDWFPAVCDPSIAEEAAPGYVEEFNRRHPGVSLKESLLSFIDELREEGRKRGVNVLVVSNQAYRCGAEVMASVDWDISESYFTDVRNGKTILFPWEKGNWESPATYVPELVSSTYDEARKMNFRLGFTHVSYALAKDVDAAFYAFAGAMVFGQDGIAQTPSELSGEVVKDGVPNAYWLGCFQYRMNSSEWAIAVYDLGIVAAGQVPLRVPEELRGIEVYDLREGKIRKLDRIGRDGPWGAVFLRLPSRQAVLSCRGKRLEIGLWSGMVEGVAETIAKVGNCSLTLRQVNGAERVRAWSWREASREVAIVSNDIDWNLSGRIIEEKLRGMGVDVFRASLSLKGIERALLDSKVVIILGGRRSPLTGPLMEQITSKVRGWEGRLGPGRIVLWLWGQDRYGTRAKVLSHLDGVTSEVREALSPLPRCPFRTGEG